MPESEPASEADEISAHSCQRKSEGDDHDDPLSLAQPVNQVHMANPARDGDLARHDECAPGLAARSVPIQIIGAEG